MALLTLDDAKAQLNITGTGEDEELQAYVDAVGPVIERLIGPWEPRQVSEVVDGGQALALRVTPVISVTSVVPFPGGQAADVGGLALDEQAGLVVRADGGRLPGRWRVTYTAGRAEPVPATVNLAARILVQHLWRTQRAARGPVFGGGDDYSVSAAVPGLGYAVPNRVLELLEQWRLPPAVA
ncbi:phage gp6-like head-tail connector protein [Streptomyces sp. UH6]|uniref:phage gp6-like head-tail connector protein n=1 Tax=Streptomyces sp. UH6 TaxID=2748379 RepID=UPI0015D4932A|nr:phage gp6-like head-tail connector protein [Streptomyces sp. UH6]NYV72984.1 phage gp6-like head-tail connector protein [Streptomyces sp. UH6]